MQRVDVVIPCYNYAHFLEECVESVLAQAGVDVRVLILDDCSPDNTPEVGMALASRDSRVIYRRHPANKGHIATYNEGIEWAGGDLFLLLSADDYLLAGALGRASELMR
ncbi:glycosyltransferase family 2 protein, partial [Rhizobium phaseoli]